ncbi:MAG: hypothetical protein HYZ75_14330 [Elusimicrobia bacterium]|nr:hypothetical protein [Elusimicrobiota bacterium]
MVLSAAALAAILVCSARGQMRPRVTPVSAAPAPGAFPGLAAPSADPTLPAPFQLALPLVGHEAIGPVSAVPIPAAVAAPVSAAPAVPAAPYAAPARPQPLGPLAERPGTGLLVVDLKDSTKLYHEVGNRRAHAAADAVMDFAAGVAARLGGTVARRLGDGLLIAFPTGDLAQAAGERVRALLPSARALLGWPGLELHTAASGGSVIEDRSAGGFDVYGQAVERALAQASDAGERALSRGSAASEALGAADRALSRGSAASEALGAAWIQGELSLTRLERRATLFAGIDDWPRRYEADGRRRAFATVKVFHAYAAAIVARHGGELVKTSGEAVMASFEDPAAAVRAAAELQSRAAELREGAPLGDGLDLRVGVSYGRVVRQDHLERLDYFGNTVNAAARLMRRAGRGGVLLSARLLADPEAGRLVAGAGAERRRVELKGFSAPLEVYSLDGATVRMEGGESLTEGLRALGRAVLRLLPRS